MHLLSMFLPGVATGLVVDRTGPLPVLLAGCTVVGLAVYAGLAGADLAHFQAALVALGVGWNLLAIGAKLRPLPCGALLL